MLSSIRPKAGTPTMGGTVFLLTSVLASFVIGSVFHQLSNGLHHDSFILVPVWRCPIFGVTSSRCFVRLTRSKSKAETVSAAGRRSCLYFFYNQHGDLQAPLNVFTVPVQIGFSMSFRPFWLIGFSNTVNLTDGIDGFGQHFGGH